MKAEVALECWDTARRKGLTVRQAAEIMQVSYTALDQALVRAARRGDPRAVRPARRPRKSIRTEHIVSRWTEMATELPGLTYAEAASEIGCSTNALGSALSRARKAGITIPRPPARTEES